MIAVGAFLRRIILLSGLSCIGQDDAWRHTRLQIRIHSAKTRQLILQHVWWHG